MSTLTLQKARLISLILLLGIAGLLLLAHFTSRWEAHGTLEVGELNFLNLI